LKITHLINLCLTRIILDDSIKILHRPLHDSLDESILNSIEETNSFIDKCRQENNGRCLVVCKHGRSRSAAIIIAYLINKMNYSLSSAYKLVLNIRPSISPNRNYLNQLNQYASYQSKENRLRTIYSENLDEQDQ